MPMLRLATPATLLVAILAAGPARGGMINLTYSGSDPDDHYVTSVGTGSLTFADGKTTLGKADVTAFRFDFTITSTDFGLKFTDTFTFNLSDLASFSATLSATGQVTALAFQTGYQSPPDQFLAPQYLVVRSLSKGGFVSYYAPGDDAQHGTIAAATVPEPPAAALGAIGLAIAAGLSRLGRRPARGRAA